MELQQKKPTPMFWQSLEELNGDPEVLESKNHEFKQGVTEDFDIKELSGISRRRFLAAMGASAAFALTSCKNYLDNGEVIPYNSLPEDVVIGRPNYYASTITTHGAVCSALVKAREGRPIKMIGNPEHPMSQGRMNSYFQAKIMSLYDPERLTAPIQGSGTLSSWKESDDAIIAALNGLHEKNQKAVVLTHRLMSPTARLALDELANKYTGLEVHSYTQFNGSKRDSAWKKAYGQDMFPGLHWDKADVIVALESDFLGPEGDEEAARLFASRRDVMRDSKFNRLYTVEGNLSQTGMSADYRLRLRPDAQYAFVMALANELSQQGINIPAGLSSKASAFDFTKLAGTYALAESSLKHLVSDLAKSQGKALLYAGDRLPESVHLAVHAINDALGANKLYRNEHGFKNQLPLRDDSQLANLVSDMKSGKIGVLIHWDTNPAYDLAALGYAEALAKVPMSAVLSTHLNETAAASTYALPIHHDLESWGDYETHSGLFTLQQPIIAPLHDSRQAEGIFLTWKSGATESYSEKQYLNYLKTAWQDGLYRKTGAMTDFSNFWRSAVHDGFVKIQDRKELGSFNASALNAIKEIKADSGYVLSLHPSYATLDGEFSDNGWLQEIPHPVSKVVWTNYAAMSVATAKELGVKTENMVQVTVGNTTINLPVLEQPGMADKVIAIELGYGRTKAGTIGSKVGVDANILVALGSESPMIVAKATLAKGSGSKNIVTTQNHHSFDIPREQDLHFTRGIVHEANYLEYEQDHHSAAKHGHKPFDIYKAQEYEGIKWGMAIDANKCTGCNACVMACNIENNVPVVGPEQVKKGREMHWIRLDRYYSGTAAEPKVSQQVMLCQHCDNAPCEIVCPVNATNHSPDGLNQMAYNRCVGTRYCSNNCPYKVRRFNFFDYRNTFAKSYYRKEIHQLQHNPEVTVRSRGVMEKCTYCVQRIMWARQEAIREKRELKGSDVVTACQEICPSEAIMFGDTNDPNSAVTQYRKHVTGYQVLEEWNARPSVTYVAKLRNTYEKA